MSLQSQASTTSNINNFIIMQKLGKLPSQYIHSMYEIILLKWLLKPLTHFLSQKYFNEVGGLLKERNTNFNLGEGAYS